MVSDRSQWLEGAFDNKECKPPGRTAGKDIMKLKVRPCFMFQFIRYAGFKGTVDALMKRYGFQQTAKIKYKDSGLIMGRYRGNKRSGSACILRIRFNQ